MHVTSLLCLFLLGSYYRRERPTCMASSSSAETSKKDDTVITILGFGSLLSERSSRLTFPDLKNFRLARVDNFRRVFAHPASIFFQLNVACLDSKQMSSLSVEPCEGRGFVASVFEVPSTDMIQDGIPSLAFLEREEEFAIVQVPYHEIEANNGAEFPSKEKKFGIICTQSTDEAYLHRWGKERFDDHFTKYGIKTIWNWPKDSGLKPCAVYLRHCYLAAKSMGEDCFNSFLDETFLVDRTTTIRTYLQQHPEVLQTLPPPPLVERYSG